MDKLNRSKLGVLKSTDWDLIDRLNRYRLLDAADGGHKKPKIITNYRKYLMGKPGGKGKRINEVGSYDVLVACVLAVVCLFVLHTIDRNTFNEDIVYFQTLANKM